MSRTLTISDDLYARLEAEARARGLNSVESLLEELKKTAEDGLKQRKNAVRRIDDLRESLFAKYGEMPDSVELLREDRAR
jgi:predicted CopG family antitoxin